MKKSYIFQSLVLALAIVSHVGAQDLAMLNAEDDTSTTVDFMNLSLEEMMNLKLTVASKEELTQKETPGIVTLITEEEIRKTGARDLVELLRLVPGFDFASDVQGFIGIGTRGLWGAEGKVLFLVDEHELNDLAYGAVPLGNHIAVDNIRQIEIIRGPGSAIYGGFAQYAVVKITTKQSETNGIHASSSQSAMSNAYSRGNYNFAIGSNTKALKWSLSAFYGDAIKSNREYTDAYGQIDNLRNNSGIKTRSLNLGLRYKTLNFSAFFDSYTNESIDFLGQFNYRPENGDIIRYNVKYETMSYLLNNTFKISNKFKITPEVGFKYQNPWQTIDTSGFISRISNPLNPDSSGYYFSYSTARSYAKVEATFDPNEKISILAGVKYYNDQSWGNNRELDKRYQTLVLGIPPNSAENVSYHNASVYAQSNVKTPIVNFTLGARYDRHSLGFDAFVPRLAIIKSFNKFHSKFLASQSFRTPTIFNLTDASIKPEIATVFELELGGQVSKNIYIGANVFDNSISKPIYYFTTIDANTGDITEGYTNGNKTGTRGFEIDTKLKLKQLYANITYSFYDKADKNSTEVYSINQNDLLPSANGSNANGMLLGFSQHKVTLNAIYDFANDWSVNCNVVYNSAKFAYSGYNLQSVIDDTRDADGDNFRQIKEFPATIIANIFLRKENAFVPNLGISIGCYNVLNENYQFVNAYKTAHQPIPSASREYSIKLSYLFDFSKPEAKTID
ncbi:MAG: TonB-dependent receptor plug domain-containing protein [Cytophagales bacterium]